MKRGAARLVCTAGSPLAGRRLRRLEERGDLAGGRVEALVRGVLAAVERGGDRALVALTWKFDRGYERIEEKLSALGATIRREAAPR